MWIEHLVVRWLNRRKGAGVYAGSANSLLLGHSVQDGRPLPVRMPDARLPEHMLVVGKTGAGKSHFLLHLALEHMRRGYGFVFFDFHADATHALVSLAGQISGAADRLVVIDPTHPARSPGLNPLETRGAAPDQIFGRASELAAILRDRWGVDAFGPRTEEVLRSTLYTLACHGLTLVEAPKLLTSAPFRQHLALRLPSSEVRSYWQDRFEPLSEAMKAAFREPLLNKITGFLTEPAVRHVLGQAESTVRFDEHMAAGHWVVVNLDKGRLREHAHTLANLIFAKLGFDVLARSQLPPTDRRLFGILCDEVQNLAENDLATLLTEGRKFGIAIATANQFWEQLPRHLRGALLATGTQVLFRLSTADAKTLAPEVSATGSKKYVGLLTSLQRGEAIVRIGSGVPQRMRVPALPAAAQRSGDDRSPLYSLSVERYTKAREQIEREIRRRGSSTTPTVDGPPNVDPYEGQHEW